MLMDLFILRHGEAEPRAADVDEFDRALTSKGKEDVRKVTAWIKSADLSFDTIATSPLKRAKDTADIVAKSLGKKSEIWPSLAPEGDRKALALAISRLEGAGSLLIVGHEPLLSTFISQVIAGDDRASILLAKGGMARIKNVTVSDPIAGDLHWLITPKQVPTLK